MGRSGNHWSPHDTKLPWHLSHIQHFYDVATGSILQYNSCFFHQQKRHNRQWALSTTQWTDKSSDFTSLVQKELNLFPNNHRKKCKIKYQYLVSLNQHNTVIISHIDFFTWGWLKFLLKVSSFERLECYFCSLHFQYFFFYFFYLKHFRESLNILLILSDLSDQS